MSWKTWTTVALMIIVVFAIYLWAAPQPAPVQATKNASVATDAEGAADTRPAPRPSSSRVAIAAKTPGVEPIHKEWLDPQPGEYQSKRNLFAFPPPPPPPPPPKPKYVPPPPVVVAPPPQPVVPEPPPKPVPPPFTYKCIGTFGEPSNPIATFNGNGEIINARVGDVIAGKFVLRNIGIESVTIGFVGFPPDQTQRVPIGQ